MKIWGNIPKINGVYSKQNRVENTKKTSNVTKRNDEISISNQAREYQTAIKALKDVPDIRSEKVNEISEKIDSGTYNVEAKEVTSKMIQMMTNKNV